MLTQLNEVSYLEHIFNRPRQGGVRGIMVKKNKTEQIKNILKIKPKAGTRKIAKLLNVSTRMVRYVKSNKNSNGDLPKILILDIETSPMEVYVWGLYKQRVGVPQIIKDWSILSWSAKWLMKSKIHSAHVTPKEAQNRDDFSVMTELHTLLNEADIVVAHNGIRFDIRKINTRLIKNGFSPTLPYQTIDTLTVAKKVFGMSSYSLDYLTKFFMLNQKGSPAYSLWKKCVAGDKKALDEMEKYNKNDVVILEELYIKLRPWIKSHPNVGLYLDIDTTVCPNCGNKNLTWDGYYYTPAGKYKTFQCICGAIGRSRYNGVLQNNRKTLSISTAR